MLPPSLNHIDPTGWRRLNRTEHGAYWLVEPGIIATVPNEGAVHSADIARGQLDRLHNAIRDHGQRCGNIVFVDPVASQDPQARRVWAEETDPNLLFAASLIASSLLARAIGSFFIGLRRPVIPTRMFARFDSSVDWMREQRELNGGPLYGIQNQARF